MSDNSPNYHNFIYSAVVILGLVIASAAIYISSSNIEDFERNTSRIHRLISASETELDTLESEARVIEATIKKLSTEVNQNKKLNTKTQQHFYTLKQNISDLRIDIAEKQKLLITLNLLKTDTLSQIKTLFWINSFLLVFGSLMIIIGVSALVFKLEIFKDRRQNKRSEENAA